MLKVMTIVGTRPEIIRLSRTIAKLDEYCEHTLVHTGQNYDYELNELFFIDLGIRKPDVFLDAAGKNASESIGKIIIAADQAMEDFEPGALLLLGDTNSSLSAIPAKRRKIPIFHMEAGNRCFDFRVPEEINRRIVDHTADINLPYSEIARSYLLSEGLPPDQVIKTGSPMREVLEHYADHINESNILERIGVEPGQYFVVSFHREENVDSNESLLLLIEILNDLAENYALPIIFSTHPRTRKRLDYLSTYTHENIKFLKPFGFFDYIKLQTEAKCVLSDSGTITEESSILNFPALNIREVHERPEGFEEASVIMVGLNLDAVNQALNVLDTQPRGSTRLLRIVNDYSPLNVSDKILRIILSYTGFVNRKVWGKSD
ncbi:UDP-N-acetylglucosamine 2-epimerase (non-hydrolyzing) [Amylibacter sp.]|nr:UDP-N-acetylglucosamine 2-epimerase (non-hydrolyzing) [Amylibacter sp.]